jgi:Holliday junction resolvase RusA-like endonuclease
VRRVLWKLIAELYIPGPPIAQPRPRLAKRGRFAHAYVPQTHPIHEYRRLISEAAKETGMFFKGAVHIEFEFIFQRPKSHWNKSGLTKKAPKFPSKSDWDNCAKGAQDALNGIAFHDDNQVVSGSFFRGYSDDRDQEGYTKIRISNAKKRSG